MRKQWTAMLTMLGLASSAMPVRSQVLKGSTPATTKENTKTKTVQKVSPSDQDKLKLRQQTLRQQSQGGGNAANNGQTKKAVGQNTGTCRYSEGCQTQNKANAAKGNQQITKGNNQQITKGNQQITKGNNQQITKGNNQQITKGNQQQLTKGNNQQITKGNQQITKGNKQQITKGNANQQVTKGNQQITKGSSNQAITKGRQNQQITKGNQGPP